MTTKIVTNKDGKMETREDYAGDSAKANLERTRRELRDMIGGNTQFHDDPLAKPKDPEPAPLSSTDTYDEWMCGTRQSIVDEAARKHRETVRFAAAALEVKRGPLVDLPMTATEVVRRRGMHPALGIGYGGASMIEKLLLMRDMERLLLAVNPPLIVDPREPDGWRFHRA